MKRMLKGIVRGIGYALEGYKAAFLTDKHFRINLLLSLAGTSASLLLLEGLEALVVSFINYLVLVLELVNTAIESAVDTATTEFHPSAKVAKDVSAAAVLTAGLFALVVDIMFLIPKLMEFLRF